MLRLKKLKNYNFLFFATILILVKTLVFSADKDFYTSLSLGGTFSQKTKFADKNSNSGTSPALFGEQTGENGRSIGARGDYGSSVFVGAGFSYDLDFIRLEAILGWHPDYTFLGQANFINVPLNEQPVSSSIDSKSAMIGIDVNLASVVEKKDTFIYPYFGGSIGVAHNELDKMKYRFPTISRDAVTLTPSGTWTGFSWAFSAGFLVSLTSDISLKLDYKYHDLGKVQTDKGTATIIRPNLSEPLMLIIAPTEASMHVHNINLSILYKL